MQLLQKKKLFNPYGSDEVQTRQLFNGDTSNVLDLNNTKYDWAVNIYKKIREAFWIPQKIDLVNDTKDYLLMSSQERKAFDIETNVFLDTKQVVFSKPFICRC